MTIKKYIIPSLLCIALFTACEKQPINGKVDGFWKLKSIETDKKESYPESIFYAIQLHSIEMSNKSNGTSIIGDFFYKNDCIIVSNFTYPHSGKPVSHPDLANFGITHTPDTFNLEKVSKSAMIWQSKTVKLQFIRF